MAVICLTNGQALSQISKGRVSRINQCKWRNLRDVVAAVLLSVHYFLPDHRHSHWTDANDEGKPPVLVVENIF